MCTPTLSLIATSVSGLRRWPLPLVGLLLTAIAPLATAGIGDVDPTYGVNGRFEARRYGDFFVYPPLADGRLLYPANDGYRRTDANGRPDPSFGSGGVQSWPQGYGALGSGTWARARDGKLLVALNRPGPDGSEHALMRLGFDGEPDLAFGANGIATVDILPDGFRIPTALAIQPDGKSLLLLARQDPRDYFYFDGLQLLRFLPDGRLDTAFGTGGIMSVPTGRIDALDGVSLGLLSDGRIVVGTDPVSYLTEFGELTSGPPAGSRVWLAALLPEGAEITWVATDTGIRLAKKLADGSFDGSFGPNGDGTVTLPSESGGWAYLSGVSVSSDGRYIYASWGMNSDGHWRVSRLFANAPGAGRLDTSFGRQGTVDLESTAVHGDVLGLADGSAIVTTAYYAYRLLGRADPSPGIVGRATNEPSSWLESGGVAELHLFRAAGSDGPVSVHYATLAGPGPGQSATPGVDYDAVSGTVDWADGDDGDKVIRIPLRPDKVDEDTEQIYVALEVLSPGTWSADSLVAVAIYDNMNVPTGGGGMVGGSPVQEDMRSGGVGSFGWPGLLLMLAVIMGRRYLRQLSARRMATAVVFAVAATPGAHAGVGDVDPTYGVNGVGRFEGGPYPPLADGRLLYPVEGGYRRTDADGRPDGSFGSNGLRPWPEGMSPKRSNYYGGSSWVQDWDGRLLVLLDQPGIHGTGLAVLRLGHDGEPDPGFGSDGLAKIDDPSYSAADTVASLQVQPDDKLLLLLARANSTEDWCCDQLKLFRLMPDGRLDVGFGSGGSVSVDTRPFDPSDGWVVSFLIDGRMIVATSPATCLTASGAQADCALSADSTQWSIAALLPDGSAIATSLDGRLAKVRADGSFDETFGPNGDGTVTLAAELDAPAYLDRLSASQDGRYLYVSWGSVGNDFWRVSRLIADGDRAGRLDVSFGQHGTLDLKSYAAAGVVHGLGAGRAIVRGWFGHVYRLLGQDEPSPGFTAAYRPRTWLESEEAAELRVFRAAGSDGAVRLRYWTLTEAELEGRTSSATPGVDFDAVSGVLDWSDRDDGDKVIHIPLRKDQHQEGAEQIYVGFEALTPSSWNAQGVVAVTVQDAARPPATRPPAGGQNTGGGSNGGGSSGWPTLLLMLAGAMGRRFLRRRSTPRVGVSLQAPVLLLLSGLAHAQLAPGDVDPTFVYQRPAAEPPHSTNAVPGPGGYLVIRSGVGNRPGGDSSLALTLIDWDGRIVDDQFGADGTYENIVAGAVDLALVTRRANGSVLLGGYKLKGGSTTDSMAAVARVNGTGRLDPAFGEAGIATIDAPGELDRVAAVAVLPDGRIAALVWSMYPIPYDCAADQVRLYYLQPDGTDPRAGVTLNRDSYAATSCRTSATLHVDPDGTVLVGTELGVFEVDGVASSRSLLPFNWRYGPFAKDGQLGLVGSRIGGQGVGVFVGGNPLEAAEHEWLVGAAGFSGPATWSKLVVDGERLVVYVAFATDGGQVGVARFNADGTLDTGWGGGDGVVAIIGSGRPADGWVGQGLATEARLVHVDAAGNLVVMTADGIMQRLRGGSAPTPGAFVLLGPTGSVAETAAPVPVTVRRAGGSTGAASVTVRAVACGSTPDRGCGPWNAAQPDADFRSMSQRLDWADGDATDRTVSIQVLDDAIDEPIEAFLVEISEVSEGFSVPTRHLLVLIDSNDKPLPDSTPTEPGHAGRGGSGRTGLIVSLLLAALALRRHWAATGCRETVSARNGA